MPLLLLFRKKPSLRCVYSLASALLTPSLALGFSRVSALGALNNGIYIILFFSIGAKQKLAPIFVYRKEILRRAAVEKIKTKGTSETF